MTKGSITSGNMNCFVPSPPQDGQHQGSTLTSDDLENLFLAQPDSSIQFQASSQKYEINFKGTVSVHSNRL